MRAAGTAARGAALPGAGGRRPAPLPLPAPCQFPQTSAPGEGVSAGAAGPFSVPFPWRGQPSRPPPPSGSEPLCPPLPCGSLGASPRGWSPSQRGQGPATPRFCQARRSPSAVGLQRQSRAGHRPPGSGSVSPRCARLCRCLGAARGSWPGPRLRLNVTAPGPPAHHVLFSICLPAACASELTGTPTLWVGASPHSGGLQVDPGPAAGAEHPTALSVPTSLQRSL